MPVFVINLDRRPDRMVEMATQLRALGLDYQRFAAIDGADPAARVAQASVWRFVINQKKWPVRGELACAASHIELWHRFLASEATHALILEDDVSLSTDLPHVLDHAAALAHFDFLNLSSADPYRVGGKCLAVLLAGGRAQRPRRFDRAARRDWRRIEWRRTWRIFRLLPFPGGRVACECDPAPALASGYILSRRAAREFIAAAGPLISPVDLVWRFAGGRLVQGFLDRPVVLQTRGDTDIAGRFDQPRMPLPYRLLRMIFKNRRLRRRLDVLRMYGWLRH